QCKVRFERSSVAFEPQRLKRFGNRGDEFLKGSVRFDSDPENARRLWGREEPCTAETEFRRRGVHLPQGVLDFALLPGLAEKLQGDVKGLGSDPTHLGRERPHFVTEPGDALANVGFDIEGYEEAHRFTSTCGAPDQAPAD